MNVTAWSNGLEVTGDGTGIVSHAGLGLLRRLADKTGVTAGFSRALWSGRVLGHDRGRVLADMACVIAGGAQRFPGAGGSEGCVRAGRVGADGVPDAGGDRGRR